MSSSCSGELVGNSLETNKAEYGGGIFLQATALLISTHVSFMLIFSDKKNKVEHTIIKKNIAQTGGGVQWGTLQGFCRFNIFKYQT